MNLPIDFKNRMNKMLGTEYEAFIASFSDAPKKGVHVNCAFDNPDILLEKTGLCLDRIPNIRNGYYIKDEKIGHLPEHHAGIVYSQDPCAMLPVGNFPVPVDKNWNILDLCAAPGGKTSQLAMQLAGGTGTIIANEINPSRNKTLISNMERMGYTNVIVTKLSPDELSKEYPACFDLILTDAPCSGEGMFRKYPESTTEWSLENVVLCASRQKEILIHAVACLKPGGYLIYSTCTYSLEENEEICDWLEEQYPLQRLQPECRCYPHVYQGEGQFMCYFQKNGTLSPTTVPIPNHLKKISPANRHLLEDALKNSFPIDKYTFYEHNDKIFILPPSTLRLPSHGITMMGVTAGVIERKRFIPHHHLFHAYGKEFYRKLDLQPSDSKLAAYLHGDEIYDEETDNGYGVVMICGCPIGGFKASNHRLKNHYPKGLRNMK